MNVLFVTYDFPYPTNSGGKNRAYHLLKYTAKKANIFLFSFVREEYDPEHNNEMLKLGVKDIMVFKRKRLKKFSNIPKTLINNSSIFKTLYFDKDIEHALIDNIKKNKIDVVHFESSYTGYYIGQNLRLLKVKQVLGTENIEFRLYNDYAKYSRKFYLKPFILFEAGKLKNEELGMFRNADAITTITQEESDTIKSLTGKVPKIVANGIEPADFLYKFTSHLKNNLLFVGNFSYFPNTDAIRFFYKEVFNLLDKKITLTIVGKGSRNILGVKDPRVITKEFVEDIISEYRNADVLVFPIRIGGGTNFKVLEAMSLGIPIVAHPQRLVGLKAIAQEHFLEATTGVEYSSQINRLYEDTNLREQLAKNSRKLIDKNYSWENIAHNLLKVWNAS